MKPRLIAKALVAFFGGLGTWGATAAADGSIELVEAFGICGVIAVAIAVFAKSNDPG